MWTTYRVRWEFLTQLCASVPGDSDLIRSWLEARAPRVRPPESKSLDEVAEEVISSLAEQPPDDDEPADMEVGPTLVFQRVTGVLAVRMATIKAHLKDSAYQIQTYLSGYVQGEKSLRTKVANGVYWPMTPPVLLHNGTPFVPVLDKREQPMTAPTSVRQKAIHVVTRQGQRSALKAFEYVEDAVIEFPLAILTSPTRDVRVPGKDKRVVSVEGQPLISDEDLRKLFQYGGMHGYAGERSEDGGRYVATWTRVDSAPSAAA